jgi:hypothetical protein
MKPKIVKTDNTPRLRYVWVVTCLNEDVGYHAERVVVSNPSKAQEIASAHVDKVCDRTFGKGRRFETIGRVRWTHEETDLTRRHIAFQVTFNDEVIAHAEREEVR